MSPPDTHQRGTRNYNKRIDRLHIASDSPFVVTSAALGRPSRNGEVHQGMWASTHLPGTLHVLREPHRTSQPIPPSRAPRTFALPPPPSCYRRYFCPPPPHTQAQRSVISAKRSAVEKATHIRPCRCRCPTQINPTHPRTNPPPPPSIKQAHETESATMHAPLLRLAALLAAALTLPLGAQTLIGTWQGTLPTGQNPRLVAQDRQSRRWLPPAAAGVDRPRPRRHATHLHHHRRP